MKQIHFDPTNQEAMNALMDEHGKSKTMYPGTNEHGESVYISIFEDKLFRYPQAFVRVPNGILVISENGRTEIIR